MGSGSLMSLNQMTDSDTDDDPGSHLACACNAALTMCGVYVPDVDGVFMLAPDAKICPPCLRVWQAGGCGRCSCGPDRICAACVESAAD